MTPEEIDSNVKIAKFMGAEVFEESDIFETNIMRIYAKYEAGNHPNSISDAGTKRQITDLEYHKRWNWIMPAWKKFYYDVIRTEWYANFCDDESNVCFECIQLGLETGNIENVFKFFVRLIEWYGNTKRVDLSSLAGTYDSKGVEDVLHKMKKAVYDNKPLESFNGLVGSADPIGAEGVMGEHCITDYGLSGIPTEEIMFDWNKLNLDQMAEYLEDKYRILSSGEALCVHHLVEFYKQNKSKK